MQIFIHERNFIKLAYCISFIQSFAKFLLKIDFFLLNPQTFYDTRLN